MKAKQKNQRGAKLLWNYGQWWVRYPRPDGTVCHQPLQEELWEDAFEEANRFLNHEPDVEWIIA